MRKKLWLMMVLLVLGMVTGCETKTESDQPVAGIIVMCEPIDHHQFLLLHNEKVYTDKLQPPTNKDTIAVYDTDTAQNTILFKGEDIWHSYEDQLLYQDDKIVYNNLSNIIQLIKTKNRWNNEAIEIEADTLKNVSPDMMKYAERQENNVVIKDWLTYEILAVSKDLNSIGQMVWNSDGDKLAMIVADRSGVVIWNWADNGYVDYYATADEQTLADWVEISSIRFIDGGDKLLINYLCESGNALVVQDSTANRSLASFKRGGDITVLDSRNNEILYAVKQDKQSLQIYDYLNDEHQVIDEGDGVYTAGCFSKEAQTVVVNRYHPAEKQNDLVIIAY